MKPSRTIIYLAGAGLLAFSPYAIGELQWMWNSENYSFFPIIALFAAWFFFSAYQEEMAAGNPVGQSSGRINVFLFAISVLFLLAASFTSSNWFGWVGFLLWICFSAIAILPPPLWEKTRPLCLLIPFVIPIPLAIDSQIVVQLQKIATTLASNFLDFVGIYHDISGVALRTNAKTYFVEEACSGVHSLYSSVAAIAMYSILQGHRLVRFVIAILFTVLWVLIGNAFRVAAIVCGFEIYKVDLIEGTPHQILGFIIFFSVVLLSLSTDQFFQFVIPQRTRDRVKESKRKRAPLLSSSEAIAKISMAMTVVIALIGIGGGYNYWNASQGSSNSTTLLSNATEHANRETLPAEIDGWKLTNFEIVKRPNSDAFGSESLLWTYTRDNLVATISLDGSYPEWHDLFDCYRALGWKLRESAVGIASGNLEMSTNLRLYNDALNQAYIVFVCFDSKAEIVKPPSASGSLLRQLENRFTNLLGLSRASRYSAPVYQVQLYSASLEETLPHESQQMNQLFDKCVTTIRSSWNSKPAVK